MTHSYLIFGATGQTGRPFVDLLLSQGHAVRAVVRDRSRVHVQHSDLDVVEGSVTDALPYDDLLDGVNRVVAMVGDAPAQQHSDVMTDFVQALVPAMRRRGDIRLLFQAGAFSAPPNGLPLPIRLMAPKRGSHYFGQHRDNAAVMRYLTDEASDVAWVVHRAALRPGDGGTRVLKRSRWRPSIATFAECAHYSYRLIEDPAALHTCDTSRYRR